MCRVLVTNLRSTDAGSVGAGTHFWLRLGRATVQLKRALRGSAFATGALFPLRAAAQLMPDIFKELLASLKQIEKAILEELKRVRGHESE